MGITLKQFLDTNHIDLSDIHVRTSDTYYDCSKQAVMEEVRDKLIDNLMYQNPIQFKDGTILCFVQD